MQMKPTDKTPQPHHTPFSRCRWIPILMILALSLLCLPSRGVCEMAAMSDDELSQVTGHGFSEFTLTNVDGVDIARIDLNVQASTYATMDSLKMGYWDNDGTGWDQNWLGVSIGSDSTDMVLNGFVLQAEFTNIDNADIRALKSVTMGFQSATGTLSGTFASLSELESGYSRESVGAATYTFDGDPILMHINVDGDNAGIWLDFGSATRSE